MYTSYLVQTPRIIVFKSPQLRIIPLLNKHCILRLNSKELFIRLHWFKETKILKPKWTIYYRNLINRHSKEKMKIWMKSFLQIQSHLESEKKIVNPTNIIEPLWIQFNIPFLSLTYILLIKLYK